MGLESGTTPYTSVATIGLVGGSLMEGPVGRKLIQRRALPPENADDAEDILIEDEVHHKRSVHGYAPAAYQIVIAMGSG